MTDKKMVDSEAKRRRKGGMTDKSNDLQPKASDLQPKASSLKPKPQIIPLALLDGYKVRWKRETVARDVVQNFFDEVADFREVTIDVRADERTIAVRGPSQFDFEYLKYIGGTTKADPGRRTAGGFGEGMKICALVLLRDYGCSLTVGSGAWEARCVLRPVKLGRELCYELRRLADHRAYPGSFVHITGADRALCDAFASAKDLFRHPDNPRLQKPLYVDDQTGIGVYLPQSDRYGHLYYRRQHRGQLRFSGGGALTFCFDDRIDKLEGDRDRRNMAAASPLVAALAARLPSEQLGRLLRHLRVYWAGGNRVLTVLATEAARRGLKLTFPPRWLARAKDVTHLHQHAERAGFHLGVQVLGHIGMRTVEERFGKALEPRQPTAIERARMHIAADLYRLLARAQPVFTSFRVADAAVHHPTDLPDRSCVVRSRDLSAPFEQGIVPCLGALALGRGVKAHTNGDRLTGILTGAVRHAGSLGPYAERWEGAAIDPSREEAGPLGPEDEYDPDDDLPRANQRLIMFVDILAPAGFPPADVLSTRIAALCKAHQVPDFIWHIEVHGATDAVVEYARGIPSIWVGPFEVEPVRGRRPSYSVRTFTQPDGTQALLPSDDRLNEVILMEISRLKKLGRRKRARYRERRRALGNKAWVRFLRSHDPGKHREVAIREALDKARKALPRQLVVWDEPEVLRDIAYEIARRELLGRTDADVDSLAAMAAPVFVEATDEVVDVMFCLEEKAKGILDDRPPHREALERLLRRMLDRVRAATPWADVVEEALYLSVPLLELYLAADAAPLDADCARTCQKEADGVFWQAVDAVHAKDNQGMADAAAEALRQARARLDAAAAHAISWHARAEEREEEELPCRQLKAVLDALFRPEMAATGVNAKPRSEQEEPSAVEVAVRRAWERAMAEGLSEVEAARRCLEAATAAADDDMRKTP